MGRNGELDLMGKSKNQPFVISRKDQAQYWCHMEVPYSYVSVDMFSRKFKESHYGKKIEEDLSKPYDKSQSHKDALSFSVYSLSKWELFRACASRELLLILEKSETGFGIFYLQLFIIACITMTVFLRTQMDIDVLHGSYYMEFCFYPAWAYAIPSSVLKVPLSFVESLVWTSLTYYVIGYSPEIQRFFHQFILLFALHFSSLSMFRFLASVFQTDHASLTAGSFAILLLFLFASMPVWLKWGFWVSPLTYGEIGLTLNEFLAPRCKHSAPGSSRAIISHEKPSKIQSSEDPRDDAHVDEKYRNSPPHTSLELNKGRMALPFTPLTLVFQDVQYYLDTPLEMREWGFPSKRLQLLSKITGSLRPGVLTALMGVSGSGKTTLLDVLAGRKTSDYLEGQIKIGGYPKVQETFARISGYCEHADIHSPQITVEESVIFSAWLRLPPEIDSETKVEFVNEVLETIELSGIKDALVGIPGVTGLSTEQRKRLTIAVELVANPSIIIMDEPTTGLDARAAAIVIQAVKNVVDTGRTIVCTIHQPCIFLLKTGGQLIYSGPLGQHSSWVIEYFDIRNNYNPATWMLEVTSTSAEAALGVDFAQNTGNLLYMKLVRKFSSPPPGSRDLYFIIRFSQNSWEQSPAYNLMRIMHSLVSALIFGILYWNKGKNLNNQQDLFNIFGSMYATVTFLGINNCSAVQQYVTTERTVMYRERFAGMYSSWAYSLAQVIVEVPYLFLETAIFVTITYPMIGYYGSASRLFWYFYATFCSLLYFSYLGMLLVSLTPNFMITTILSFYTIFNLFAGFLVPEPQIPKWWIWLYHLTPTSWSLNGLLTSQYGDINMKILVFGETKTIVAFLKDYLGFHHDCLALVAVVLLAFPLVFAFLVCIFYWTVKLPA
ncbi:pleiotropic drug resistance protein 3-like isoform X1 [Fagus crenata]